ncbi:MAG: DMT family transporter [Xenococcus sp. (in: cyanobacteria)]
MMQSELASPRQEKTNLVAIFTLCIALLSVSFAPIFIRFSETELGANATVLNRLLIFVLVFGLGRFISSRISPVTETDPEPTPLTIQQWILLASVGLISIMSLVLWAISLEYTTVAKSMLLNNLTPIFTSLGAWLLFGQRFDKRFLVGMAIALIGAIALGLEDLNGAEGSLFGDFLALLSAVFLGSYFLMVEQLRNRFSATTILLWRCAIGSLLLIPVVLFTREQMFPTTNLAILGVIGLGIISEGFGQRLLADTMDKLSSSFVSLFLLLEPIVSAILAWIIFTERLSSITWVGFAVVLTGIYLAQSSNAALQKSE